IMARIKIEMPEHFSFITYMPIRITDLNYGGHVGNDMILSIIHEIRVQFLQHFGYKEFDLEGTGLIMNDVAIEFKNEIFYGDKIKASVVAGEFSKVRFEIFYKLEKETAEKNILVANAKTGMVCYNYADKKIVNVPLTVVEKLKG
ncbi:MAG TPA: thioesterase family protein, partial [Puia sp.]|nr:thioesterase family protein [Puia sp.]